MNFFTKSKTRTPADTVRLLKDNIVRLDSSGSGESRKRRASGIPGLSRAEELVQTNEDISRLLSSTKAYLSGENEGEASTDVVAQVANEVYAQDLLSLMIINISKFEFEARKDISHIYNTLLRRQIGTRSPTVEYISGRPDIIFNALKGYSNADVALNTGMILKEMLRYEPLARILLHSDQFYTFPSYIENTTFGISCDALANMKDTLTKHKPMVATYLDANYDRFFNMYNSLILSANYVTKRQSLKLLGEILLDRANYSIMTRYIASEANLKLMMNFLRDKSKNIQFEAFHVFKVFVANPNKPPQIASILRRNKDKLLVFLKEFHNDKDDEQFNDEKQFLIAQNLHVIPELGFENDQEWEVGTRTRDYCDGCQRWDQDRYSASHALEHYSHPNPDNMTFNMLRRSSIPSCVPSSKERPSQSILLNPNDVPASGSPSTSRYSPTSSTGHSEQYSDIGLSSSQRSEGLGLSTGGGRGPGAGSRRLSVSSNTSTSSKVSFAPLPEIPPELKRRNSIAIGVASRKQLLTGQPASAGGGGGVQRSPVRTTDSRGIKKLYMTDDEWEEYKKQYQNRHGSDAIDLGELAKSSAKSLWRKVRSSPQTSSGGSSTRQLPEEGGSSSSPRRASSTSRSRMDSSPSSISSSFTSSTGMDLAASASGGLDTVLEDPKEKSGLNSVPGSPPPHPPTHQSSTSSSSTAKTDDSLASSISNMSLGSPAHERSSNFDEWSTSHSGDQKGDQKPHLHYSQLSLGDGDATPRRMASPPPMQKELSFDEEEEEEEGDDDDEYLSTDDQEPESSPVAVPAAIHNPPPRLNRTYSDTKANRLSRHDNAVMGFDDRKLSSDTYRP